MQKNIWIAAKYLRLSIEDGDKRQFFISVLLTIKRRINVPDIVSEKMC